MKKSSIVAISVMGTVGGLLLAIGMCMCLLPEWNAFVPGVVLAVIGAITLLAIWPVAARHPVKPSFTSPAAMWPLRCWA